MSNYHSPLRTASAGTAGGRERSTRTRYRHSTGLALTALWLLQSLVTATGAEILTPEARRDLELRPGVVWISIPLKAVIPELGVKCDGRVSGTGFLFRPDGYLLTNGHVAQLANVQDAAAKQARNDEILGCLLSSIKNRYARERQEQGRPPLTKNDEQKLYGVVLQYLKDGKIQIDAEPAIVGVCLDTQRCYSGEIKAYSAPFVNTVDAGKDVAVIKIDGHDLPTVPIGNSDEVNVNDPVYVIGYPGGADVSDTSTLVATSTDGRISAIKRLDHPDVAVLQTSAMINPGNSGGPAFDAQGNVIGIATFKKGVGNGESYNYLIPINVAMEYVRQAGVAPERGAFDTLWHGAVADYTDGRWAEAHKHLQDVLEMLPNQPEAERLLHEAAARERNAPSGGIAANAPNPDENIWQKLTKSFGTAGAVLAAALVCALVIGLVMRTSARRPVVIAGANPAPADRPPGGERLTRIVESAPPAAARAEKFGTLHVSGGPLAGNRFAVPKEGLVIGRDPTRCAITLPDDSVSKEHAWVVPLDDGVAVIDRNSANGTYVNSTNSARANKVYLRNGDRIFLGKSNPTVFTYHSG